MSRRRRRFPWLGCKGACIQTQRGHASRNSCLCCQGPCVAAPSSAGCARWGREPKWTVERNIVHAARRARRSYGTLIARTIRLFHPKKRCPGPGPPNATCPHIVMPLERRDGCPSSAAKWVVCVGGVLSLEHLSVLSDSVLSLTSTCPQRALQWLT